MFLPMLFHSREATEPVGNAPWPFFVVNICDDLGKWDARFSMKVAERWPKAKRECQDWFQRLGGRSLEPGEVQFVNVGNILWVANLIGRGPGVAKGRTPLNYAAFQDGLKRIADYAEPLKGSIHISKAGLKEIGADWEKARRIIDTELCARGLPVTVYTGSAAQDY